MLKKRTPIKIRKNKSTEATQRKRPDVDELIDEDMPQKRRRLAGLTKRWQEFSTRTVVRGASEYLVLRYRPQWRRLFIVALLGMLGVSVLVFSGLNILPRTARGFLVSPNQPNTATTLCSEEVLASDAVKLEPKLNRKWFLIGAEFLEQNSLSLQVDFPTIPADCTIQGYKLKYQVANTTIQGDATTTRSTNYTFSGDVSKLTVGTYPVTISLTNSAGRELKVASTEFHISKPVYVVWTLDWEGYNMSDTYLQQIQQLTEREQRVPLTHFFNPLYAISSGTLKSRGQYFANWVKQRQQTFGDDAGLHVHMFYELATAAGVTPRTEPTWNSRGNGSDVPLTAYTYDEQKLILTFSKEILRQQGFTDIDSFRAGGWFANLDTFQVLSELGMTMESSGRTAYSLGNNLAGPWALAEAAQPYYPCKNNQNRSCPKGGANTFPVLEIPNNGGESYRFTTAQLLNRFKANFNGTPQGVHKVVTYLSHPEWFYIDHPKMTELLNYIDGYLYTADRGPVVYTTLDNIHRVWQVNKY